MKDEYELSGKLDEAIYILAKYSIPLYQNYNNLPRLLGTGFFVRTEQNCYLVSAAHVLDTAKKNEVFFYIKPNVIRILTGQLLRSKGEENRHNDLIDIGVLKLSNDDLPPYPEVDKYAMDISYLKPNYLPRSGKNYAVLGYPATKSYLDNLNKGIAVSLYAYHNYSIEESEYTNHGLDLNTHIAIKLDLRKCFNTDGTHRNFPKPQGMSGSPIVVLYEDEGDDDTRVFPVVAVATSFRSQSKLLFGTDVAYVLDAINNSV